MAYFLRGSSVLLAVAGFGIAQAQISFKSYDVFQTGTTLGWSGGAADVWIASGGPGGSGDGYLQVTSSGGFGMGSHLAFHNNEPRWIGNYAFANVYALEAWVRNEGAQTLSLRAVLFQTTTNRFTSKSAVMLGPFQGWTRCV